MKTQISFSIGLVLMFIVSKPQVGFGQPTQGAEAVQREAEDKKEPRMKAFSTSEISNIELDGSYGTIRFSIGKTLYSYSPNSPEGRVSAAILVLAEMRRAKSVSITPGPDSILDHVYIERLVLRFGDGAKAHRNSKAKR